MSTAAIIVAAGRGTRAGPGAPKQWRPLAGRRVIDWTVDAFLAAFPDLRIKARVMRFLNGEIARRINRLRGRTGPLFARRHQAIQVLSDAHALDRLKYLLSQGTKAFVVRHPAEDPFACANAALLLGRPLRGPCSPTSQRPSKRWLMTRSILSQATLGRPCCGASGPASSGFMC